MTSPHFQPGIPASRRSDWALDPVVTYLNHGSFGACLNSVISVQQRWRARLEANPTGFLGHEIEDLLDWARPRPRAAVVAP